MDERKHISLQIQGKRDGKKLKPNLLDIKEIRDVLDDIEKLLSPYIEERKTQRLSYSLEEGSVLHQFFVPFALATLFQGVIDKMNAENNIHFLEKKQVEVLEKYQSLAKEEEWIFELKTSEKPTSSFKIDQNTIFSKKQEIWVDTEQYVYGEVFEAGGIKPNIHIRTEDYGNLIIKAEKREARAAGNLLYQNVSILVQAKQNLNTGDLKEPKFISFESHNPKYDADALDEIIKRVSPKWKNISVDEWLNEMRS